MPNADFLERESLSLAADAAADLSNVVKAQRGMWYDANFDEGLLAERNRCKDLCFEYNCRTKPSDGERQQQLLHEILGALGENVCLIAPFYCDYGYNVTVGSQVFFNTNTHFLDTAKITFGDRVFVGPNCGFYCAAHPLQAKPRAQGYEKALPIQVGSDVWLGGNVVVMPGVTIGSNVVIGAGSVVTRDIPDNCVAVGAPCRKIKDLPPLK